MGAHLLRHCRGIDRLDPATGRIKHYTQPMACCGSTSAALQDRDGALWFGFATGLVRLVPEPDRPRSAARADYRTSHCRRAEPSPRSAKPKSRRLSLARTRITFRLTLSRSASAPAKACVTSTSSKALVEDWSPLTSNEPSTSPVFRRAATASSCARSTPMASMSERRRASVSRSCRRSGSAGGS